MGKLFDHESLLVTLAMPELPLEALWGFVFFDEVGDDVTSWSDNKHKGLIDEVGLFNAALSQDDIKSIMTSGLSHALAVVPMGKIAATWGSIKGKL